MEERNTSIWGLVITESNAAFTKNSGNYEAFASAITFASVFKSCQFGLRYINSISISLTNVSITVYVSLGTMNIANSGNDWKENNCKIYYPPNLIINCCIALYRLIVIAEKDVVYNRFPIPLINRLEKHFLVMSSGLTEPQEQLAKKLEAWVEDFAEVFQRDYENKKRFLQEMHVIFYVLISRKNIWSMCRMHDSKFIYHVT